MPTIRILKPEDQAALEGFLLPRVERSMFLLGNSRAAGLVDNGAAYQGTYAAAFDTAASFKAGAEGAMAGVVAHYWNGMLIPQAPAHLDELWRAAARASARPIGGAIGPSEQVQAIVEGWRAAGAGGCTSGPEPAAHAPAQPALDLQMDEEEKLYSLSLDELRVPEALRDGTLRARRIAAQDLDQVVAWRVAFQVESLHEEDTPRLRESTRATAARALERRDVWVVEAYLPSSRGAGAGWVPVSTSGFNTAIREAVQIGGVYTPPELRSRGYARAAVAASLLDARAEGAGTAILFTGEENVPAQRAYTALGFRHIGEFRLVLLRTPLRLCL
jgi:ribosomal protein S18 acetylase RimI-like enzyme